MQKPAPQWPRVLYRRLYTGQFNPSLIVIFVTFEGDE